jgi:hypothetical protein
MRRTQITLTDAQYKLLLDESAQRGASLAELVRQAVDQRYGVPSDDERRELLDSAFGGWAAHEETGEDFVDRVRSGTSRRLTRS